MKAQKIHRDHIVGVVCLIISVFFAISSQNIKSSLNPGDPGSKLFPLIGCGVLLVCGIGMLIKKPDVASESRVLLTKDQWKRAITLFALYILNLLIMWIFGFIVANTVMLLVLCLLFTAGTHAELKKSQIVIRAIIYTVFLSAALYLAYDVALNLQLPEGILWDLFK